ncbi:hypothetical protein BGZ79_011165 [Entomortierella chlamydospora]|nr:hypothetical protein BGZ79_011165 [Entomortierella chlamydospora]
MRPARPFARIQLTVEPDSFVLQEYHGPTANDDLTARRDRAPSLARILFEVPSGTEKDEGTGGEALTLTKDLSKDGQANVDGSKSFSGLTEGQHGRVSFITPDSYIRSESAKDYIIYGCIGLLDLYTGPHFIVITSVKPLGDIEDKPVYAISKVAVLPMEANEALQVLERTAVLMDPSTDSIIHVRQDSEQSSNIQEPEVEEDPMEQPIQPVPVKSPKIRFPFLGSKHEKGFQKPTSTPKSLSPSNSDSSLQSPVVTEPKNSKKVSFGTPTLSSGDRSIEAATPGTIKSDLNVGSGPAISSPPTSPSLSPKSFLAKLKGNILEKSPTKSTADGLSPSRKSTEIRTSMGSSDSQSDVPDVPLVKPDSDQSQPTAVESIPEVKLDGVENNKSESPSIPAPKSPSAYETAERFMIQSTKQLADWGEEAVSGVFKSSKSPTPPVPGSTTEGPVEGERGSSANNTSDNSTEEEELEKNRLLDRRVIREITSIFGKGFYFSTDFNLLSSKQKRFSKENRLKENDPLWQQVDKRFWWNEHLLKDFLEIEAHEYILPVMQGYVEIEQCVIEEQPFEFTLISRRSRERSGLRYQRRGIDEKGNTANFVETEQLLRIVRDDSDHRVSFVQTRGSIPLFWSQSPYRLKPIPIMERTEEENEEGFKKHVDSMISQYGRQIFISLVEQHGREMIAGSAYTQHVEKLAEPQVKYVEFDFHEQCKGMKYENIERLIKSIEVQIQELGYCWITPTHDGSTRKDGEAFDRLYEQKGVIRTNCMDCLDRTNVVQSAIGRHILNNQLLRLGIASFPDKGLSVYEDFENVFNNVWANNGDAISREYAGTSALKGDFTRTGKRNLQGMINDATNSMARMYQNTFKDYFRQAAIDYLLGVADVNVFKNLQTTPFGTAVVPPPVIPESSTPSQEKLISLSSPGSLALLAQIASASSDSATSTTLLPSLAPQQQISQESVPASDTAESLQERALQQETWVKIREAAIETSAEIVISPGEEHWKGWTLICCSNEISSALVSESSPQPSSDKKSSKTASSSKSKASSSSSRSKNASVFYDEKVVLLTERALYICTYDYEMEKVLEFWRLALEKMTGIDKGAYFLTAQDTSQFGLDPLENYGFAIVYKASAGGETMRVNSGSVRNRRVMGLSRIHLDDATSLGRVLEEDEEAALESDSQRRSGESGITEADKETDPHDDARSAKSLLKDEPKDIRSVRFRVVRHPETLVVPHVVSSAANSRQPNISLQGVRKTAKDCAECIVSEIIQSRRELVSEAEKAVSDTTSGLLQHFGRHHSRSPSEEYNYHSPKDARRSSVQVDLEVRERVLQSLEASAQLEKDTLKSTKKRSKKPFRGFFSSSKPSMEQSSIIPPTPSSNKSWLKLLQFGQDSDDESGDDSDSRPSSKVVGSTGSTTLPEHKPVPVTEDQPDESEIKSSSKPRRESSQSVFEKFKLAVKNF